MKNKTKKEIEKLVRFMLKNPLAAFTIAQNEVYHNGVLVCTCESHSQALQAVWAARDEMEFCR